MTKAKLFALVLLGLGLGGIAGAGVVSHRGAGAAAATKAREMAGATLVVPQAKTPIEVNGELDEAAWTTGVIARTGAFAEQPYSDARFAWQGGQLFVVLYAADEDLRTTDAGHDQPLWLADSYKLTFQRGADTYVIEISPAGTVTDFRTTNGVVDLSWESGAKVALDRDGTLNDSTDNDEEWVVEMALPLASLGLEGKPGERIPMSIQRCDLSRTQRGASDAVTAPQRKCASWGASGGVLQLGP